MGNGSHILNNDIFSLLMLMKWSFNNDFMSNGFGGMLVKEVGIITTPWALPLSCGINNIDNCQCDPNPSLG